MLPEDESLYFPPFVKKGKKSVKKRTFLFFLEPEPNKLVSLTFSQFTVSSNFNWWFVDLLLNIKPAQEGWRHSWAFMCKLLGEHSFTDRIWTDSRPREDWLDVKNHAQVLTLAFWARLPAGELAMRAVDSNEEAKSTTAVTIQKWCQLCSLCLWKISAIQ